MIAPPGVTIPSHFLLVNNHASKMQSSSTNNKKDNENTTLQGEYDRFGSIADCTYYQQKGVRDVGNAQAAR